MVRGQYFLMSPVSICIDVRAAAEFASCYGVNLAFGGFGLGFFGLFRRLGIGFFEGVKKRKARFPAGPLQRHWEGNPGDGWGALRELNRRTGMEETLQPGRLMKLQ